MGGPVILAEIVFVQVVENAIFAAANQIASVGDYEDTGGPKVLQAFEAALELPPEALRRSWSSLRQTGNLSSASVLFVLSELLASEEPRPGDLGLLMAMGPGFCAELVLLRW